MTFADGMMILLYSISARKKSAGSITDPDAFHHVAQNHHGAGNLDPRRVQKAEREREKVDQGIDDDFAPVSAPDQGRQVNPQNGEENEDQKYHFGNSP
jgi:hypothetical protein